MKVFRLHNLNFSHSREFVIFGCCVHSDTVLIDNKELVNSFKDKNEQRRKQPLPKGWIVVVYTVNNKEEVDEGHSNQVDDVEPDKPTNTLKWRLPALLIFVFERIYQCCQ